MDELCNDRPHMLSPVHILMRYASGPRAVPGPNVTFLLCVGLDTSYTAQCCWVTSGPQHDAPRVLIGSVSRFSPSASFTIKRTTTCGGEGVPGGRVVSVITSSCGWTGGAVLPGVFLDHDSSPASEI
ncbi:hypothetical protein E2C01_014995 [Portunus trituberculatus]|uniref:Uncharacterized protein n=1 Tax=Portunus trituberculatus TaxID=210409 RepID=A0A5B7DK59_PORTR|nr:hypothetical protein [Portunus trituberculatus]